MMLASAQVPGPLPFQSLLSPFSVCRYKIHQPAAETSVWNSKNLQNIFLGLVPTPLTQIKSWYFAQPETTSGQKTAYAEHGVSLIRLCESPDENFVMIKPQFQEKTKNGKGFWFGFA